MIVKSAEFVKSAEKASHYPHTDLPEIAFAGRSNVGKSTLINKLANRKRLVRVSSTPGRTRLINFFNINNAIMFVDLPGYGYAKVPASIQKQWKPMVETYLKTRKLLKAVVLIIDIRRMPGIEEMQLLEWLQYNNIQTILTLTKTDKLGKNDRKKQLCKIAESMKIPENEFILFSGKTGLGKMDLLTVISRLCENTSLDNV